MESRDVVLVYTNATFKASYCNSAFDFVMVMNGTYLGADAFTALKLLSSKEVEKKCYKTGTVASWGQGAL